jgi:hypothetical protein
VGDEVGFRIDAEQAVLAGAGDPKGGFGELERMAVGGEAERVVLLSERIQTLSGLAATARRAVTAPMATVAVGLPERGSRRARDWSPQVGIQRDRKALRIPPQGFFRPVQGSLSLLVLVSRRVMAFSDPLGRKAISPKWMALGRPGTGISTSAGRFAKGS